MSQLIFSENNINFITESTLLIVYISIVSCGIYVITTKNPILSVLFLILLFSIVACYLIQLTASFIGLSYLLVYVGAVSILFLFILMLINVRISELVTDNNNSIPLSLFIITIFVTVFNTSIIDSNYKSMSKLHNINNMDNTLLFKGPEAFIIERDGIYSNSLDLDNFINKDITFEDISESVYSSKDLLPEVWGLYDKLVNLLKGPFVNASNTNLDNSIYNANTYSWDTFVTTISHINSIGNIMYTSYPILLLIISIILLLSMIGSIVITVRR